MDLKSKAKAAFDFNKDLKQAFVTSDGQVFPLETDAKLHAKTNKLTDTTVSPFTKADVTGETPLEDSSTLIPKIQAATTVEEIYALVPSADTREDVTAAARERTEEIRAFISSKSTQPGII